jgi:hypothetical protein
LSELIWFHQFQEVLFFPAMKPEDGSAGASSLNDEKTGDTETEV